MLDPTNSRQRWAPEGKQDTDLALQRGIAPRQAGDAEVEGALGLALLQQGTEGVLGEAEPGPAAGGQLQAGTEGQALRRGHHAIPAIVRQELQGQSREGRWWGSGVALGTLAACAPRGEPPMGFVCIK